MPHRQRHPIQTQTQTQTQTLTKRPARAALALWMSLTALTAAAPAQAGLIVTQPGMWGGPNGYPTPFGLGLFPVDLDLSAQGAGVVSQAQHGESTSFRLPTGPGNSVESGTQSSTSGLLSTTVSGQTVSAYAPLNLTPIDTATFSYPVAARTTPLHNHVRARSHSELAMENDVPVTVGGTSYREFSFHKFSSNGGMARSLWYDNWVGLADATGSLKVALDGGLSINNSCGANTNCGYTIPPGITSVVIDRPSIVIEATFAVYDLDMLLPCNDIDFCGYVNLVPAAVAMLQVEFDGDRTPFSFDQTYDLPYETRVGHRYVAYGSFEIRTSNGADIDFSNTMRLAGVDLPVGAVNSAAVGDLALFFTPVPEPGTWALWLAGLLGLGALATRRHSRTPLATHRRLQRDGDGANTSV